MVLTGTFSRSMALGVVAVLGVIIAAVYVLLPYQRVFTGAPAARRASDADLDGRERLVLAPVIVAMLALGLVPGVLTDALDGVAEQISTTMSDDVAPAAASPAVPAPATPTATEGISK